VQLDNSFTVPAPIDTAWDVLLDVERIAPCMPGATLTENDGTTFGGTVKVKVGPIGLTYKGLASFVNRDDAGRTVTIEAKGRETRGSGTASATIKCAMVEQGPETRVDVNTDLAITGKPAQFGRGVMGEIAQKIIGQFATCLADEIGAPAAAAPVPTAAPATAAAPVTAPASAASPGAAAAGSIPPAPQPLVPADAPPQAPAPPLETVLQEPPAAQSSTSATPPAPSTVPAAPAPRRSAEAIDLLDVAGAPALKRLAPVLAVVLVAVLVVLARRRAAGTPT